jgi:hypothetical protein
MTSDDRITKEDIVCAVVVVICRVCRLESVIIICSYEYKLPTNPVISQNPLSNHLLVTFGVRIGIKWCWLDWFETK